MLRLCIITGLQKEAACLPPPPHQDTAVKVIVAGSQRQRALDQAGSFIADGCDGLISFGVAGALAPGLVAGDLVLADRIVIPPGEDYPVSTEWLDVVRLSISRAAITTHIGAIAGSDRPVADASEKASLQQQTGAIAVDMESHAVAALAKQTGTPFLAVRTIVDTAQQSLPLALADAVTPSGEPRPARVAAGILRRPWELFGVLEVAQNYREAISSLQKAALLCGPEFGLRNLLD